MRQIAPKAAVGSFGGGVRSRRLVLVLGLAVTVAIVSTWLTGGFGTTEGFAAFGESKRLSLPVIYTLFGAVALWRGRREGPSLLALPRVWWWLAGIVSVSSLLSIVAPTSSSSVVTSLQGLVLLSGLLVSVMLGYVSSDWTATRERQLLFVLLGSSLASISLQTAFGSFISLATPGVAVALMLALRATRHRVSWALLATLALLLYVRYIDHQLSVGPLSAAVQLEMASCALLLTLALVPRPWRAIAAFSLAVVAAVVLLRNSFSIGYFFGDANYSDVTLAQRGYETAKVQDLLQNSLVTTLFGGGPGAFVNLTLSPDVVTLLGSGRMLARVDDVHLLSSYFALKLGVAGIVWLVVLAVHVVRLSSHILSRTAVGTFELAVLMYAVAGIAVGVPAATNFVANPIPGLLLGLLARRCRRQDVFPKSALESDARQA